MRSGGQIAVRTSSTQKELSTLLAWLADANGSLGRLPAATAIRREQIALLRRIIASGNSDVTFREHLIPAHQALGILLFLQGQTDRGVEQLHLAVGEADSLLPVEPDNANWLGLSAQARLQLAATLFDANRKTEAAAEARTGCLQTRQVLARDPSAAWRSLRTNCFSIWSRLALADGDQAGALGLAMRALASAQSEKSADTVRDRFSIAAAYRLIGDARRRAGQTDLARQAWDAGLAHLPTNVAERPREMNERVQLLRRLERTEEARPQIERLAAIGYRNAS